jgi:ADP-dependent NAD(P)H-hydrate dehydratase
MKGATTWIVTSDGRAWRHEQGVVGLATSGSADVLAGLIGGFLARGAPPLVATLWGVCVHAAAGVRLSDHIGPVGFLAREILSEIPRVLRDARVHELTRLAIKQPSFGALLGCRAARSCAGM